MQAVAVEALAVMEEAQAVLVVRVAQVAVVLAQLLLVELRELLTLEEAAVVWEDKVELKAVLAVQAL
jgi:hypothetical protein